MWMNKPDRCPMGVNSRTEQRSAEALLGALALAQECGRWWVVEQIFTWPSFQRIERNADHELGARLHAIRSRLARAQEHERRHGVGSLYVKDHPFNVRVEKIHPRYAPPVS